MCQERVSYRDDPRLVLRSPSSIFFSYILKDTLTSKVVPASPTPLIQLWPEPEPPHIIMFRMKCVNWLSTVVNAVHTPAIDRCCGKNDTRYRSQPFTSEVYNIDLSHFGHFRQKKRQRLRLERCTFRLLM
ncbi:hypothetical protein E2C01_049715 [Portunus trituberculatus]|uniref:Uncharacterized protein n=1 Tax=Portunus trituberculatus TaxID=210409 RepID=A0A5B7G749_PORTR|nr:hypothetical protein [Portunus trituberculatus]